MDVVGAPLPILNVVPLMTAEEGPIEMVMPSTVKTEREVDAAAGEVFGLTVVLGNITPFGPRVITCPPTDIVVEVAPGPIL